MTRDSGIVGRTAPGYGPAADPDPRSERQLMPTMEQLFALRGLAVGSNTLAAVILIPSVHDHPVTSMQILDGV